MNEIAIWWIATVIAAGYGGYVIATVRFGARMARLARPDKPDPKILAQIRSRTPPQPRLHVLGEVGPDGDVTERRDSPSWL